MPRGKSYVNRMSRDGSLSPIITDIKLCEDIRTIARMRNVNATTVVTEFLKMARDSYFEEMNEDELRAFFYAERKAPARSINHQDKLKGF